MQKDYSNLSVRQNGPAAGRNFFLFLAAEGLIPLEKTHFRAQTPLQKRVFLTEIRLSAAKNPKISRLRRAFVPLRILEKIPYAANFWTHPPPPGGVWYKLREAFAAKINLGVT